MNLYTAMSIISTIHNCIYIYIHIYLRNKRIPGNKNGSMREFPHKSSNIKKELLIY